MGAQKFSRYEAYLQWEKVGEMIIRFYGWKLDAQKSLHVMKPILYGWKCEQMIWLFG